MMKSYKVLDEMPCGTEMIARLLGSMTTLRYMSNTVRSLSNLLQAEWTAMNLTESKMKQLRYHIIIVLLQ